MNDPCEHCQLRTKRDEFLRQPSIPISSDPVDCGTALRDGRTKEDSPAVRGLIETITESSSNAIFVWDREYRCLYANRAADRYIQAPRQSAIPWNLRDQSDPAPAYIRPWISRIDRVFQTGKRLQATDAIVLGEQSCFVESVFTPLRDGAGEVFAVSLVCRDATEQKKLEQELAENEKKYRELYNQSPVCLYRTRIRDGKLLECNKALADLLGYSSVEECKALHFSAKHYVDSDRRMILLEKLNKDKKVEGFEIQLKKVDGKQIWIEATAELYPQEGYLEGAMKDITVKKVLTDSEKEVLDLVLEGKCNKEIAKQLCRSVRTIEDHRAHIMHKLEVHNLVELALRAQSFAMRDSKK